MSKCPLDFKPERGVSVFRVKSMRWSYTGYISVGQPQDSLPVGSIDEEAIGLGDSSNVGAQRGIRAMWDRHQVSAQLPLPAPLRVRYVHTPTLVTVRAGAVNGHARRQSGRKEEGRSSIVALQQITEKLLYDSH